MFYPISISWGACIDAGEIYALELFISQLESCEHDELV